MQKEEEGLFPPMRCGEFPLPAAIALMLDDHECHAESLEKVQVLTHHFVVPDDAGPAWRALCSSTKKLADDLAAHIHIENNVLFLRFVADDSDGASQPGSSE